MGSETHEAGFPIRPCSGCEAPIIFVQSAVSRALCVLNAAPDPEGNIVIRNGAAAVLKKAELFGEGGEPIEAAAGEKRYLSHYATCPKAKQFRKSAK